MFHWSDLRTRPLSPGWAYTFVEHFILGVTMPRVLGMTDLGQTYSLPLRDSGYGKAGN
jgi:hypothetical protein